MSTLGMMAWETICEDESGNTERLRVPGGWLYRTAIIDSPSADRRLVISMVFVPYAAVLKATETDFDRRVTEHAKALAADAKAGGR